MTDRYFTTTDERVIYSNRFSFIKQDNISLKSMGSYDPVDIKEYDMFVYQGNHRIKSFIDDFACDGDFIIIKHEYNTSVYKIVNEVNHRSLSTSFAQHAETTTPVNFDKNMELYRKISDFDKNKVCEYFYKRYTDKPLSFDYDIGIWKLFIKRLRIEKKRSVTNTEYLDDQIAELYEKIKRRRTLNIRQGYVSAVKSFDLFTAFLNNDMEQLRVANEEVTKSMFKDYGITIIVGDYWHARLDPNKHIEITSIAKNFNRRGYTIVYSSTEDNNQIAVDMDEFRKLYDLHEIDVKMFEQEDVGCCDCYCDYC